jgi:hypothetical protein
MAETSGKRPAEDHGTSAAGALVKRARTDDSAIIVGSVTKDVSGGWVMQQGEGAAARAATQHDLGPPHSSNVLLLLLRTCCLTPCLHHQPLNNHTPHPKQGVKRTSNLLAPIMQLVGHGGDVLGMAFSPDGQQVASCSFDRTILLWRTYDECENHMMLRGHKNAVTEVRPLCASSVQQQQPAAAILARGAAAETRSYCCAALPTAAL